MAHILLIVSGGIAAYKACELIRLARKNGHKVTPVLTKGGMEFITALTLSALAESPAYTDLFSLKDESEMGHIRLAREADIIVIAPASANFIARLAQGRADDLAAAIALAAKNVPILLAPAMNPAMWAHDTTRDNLATLRARGVHQIGPETGDMACGEHGEGRLSEPAAILAEAEKILKLERPLSGVTAIVTSGPTFEPIDPVRFIGNRSSGRQGHAIAAALNHAGATVTLVTGPVALSSPDGVRVVAIETAAQMKDAVEASLPADIFVGAAAVADWRIDPLPQKHKKTDDSWTLTFTQTDDILGFVAQLPAEHRPRYVIGFALESEDAMEHAAAKLARKNADALLVNSVSIDSSPFGAGSNRLIWLDAHHHDDWGVASKEDHAARLADTLIELIKKDTP